MPSRADDLLAAQALIFLELALHCILAASYPCKAAAAVLLHQRLVHQAGFWEASLYC
jgi:hypothetical protein